jgi:hypothetical protein
LPGDVGTPSKRCEPRGADQENRMVKDLVDETREDTASELEPDDLPVVAGPEEEPADTQECRYCGHYPCGCGG